MDEAELRDELRTRVDLAVQQQIQEKHMELQVDRDRITREKEAMQQELLDMKAILEAGITARERDAVKAVENFSKVLDKINPADTNLRKPTTFGQPTLATSTDKFFKDYERYIRLWKPNSVSALSTYLPTYLAGKAHACYARQPTDIKDDYLAMREKITQYFQEMQEDIEMQTLHHYDSTKQTIQEYLEEAQEFFTAKAVEDKEAIGVIKLCLKGELQNSIIINRPKTWADACKSNQKCSKCHCKIKQPSLITGTE